MPYLGFFRTLRLAGEHAGMVAPKAYVTHKHASQCSVSLASWHAWGACNMEMMQIPWSRPALHEQGCAGPEPYLEFRRAAMRNLQASGWLCSCPRNSENLATAFSPPGSLLTKHRSRLPVLEVMSGVGFCSSTHHIRNLPRTRQGYNAPQGARIVVMQ